MRNSRLLRWVGRALEAVATAVAVLWFVGFGVLGCTLGTAVGVVEWADGEIGPLGIAWRVGVGAVGGVLAGGLIVLLMSFDGDDYGD